MADRYINIDNSSQLANSLFDDLTTGFTLPSLPDFSDDKFNFNPDPDSPLYKDIVSVQISDVTTDSIEGTGAFDIMMSSLQNHLDKEYKEGRIVGSEYAQVYLGGLQTVLNTATSFALSKEKTKWEAITAQMQARIAEIQATQALIDLERAKFETSKALFDMQLSGATYALTKMQIATEEANHDSVTTDVAIKQFQRNYQQPADLAITQYERTAVQPSQVAMNEIQYKRILPAQAAIAEYQNRVLQDIEADIQRLQRDQVIPTAVDIEKYRLNQMMPVELAQLKHTLELRMPAETAQIKEQTEQLYAQTRDTRTDGLTPISGVIGLEKLNLQAELDIKEYTVNNQLPTQVALTAAQVDLTEEQLESERSKTLDDRTNGDPVTGVVGLQKRNLEVEADTKDYILLNQIPTQIDLVSAQISLTSEQRESERAKTLDARSDGATVEGSVGKQKDLYDQQIDSFVKDAQHKAAKMYLDAYITQKTLDEALPVPAEFSQTSISDIMASIRDNNNLTAPV